MILSLPPFPVAVKTFLFSSTLCPSTQGMASIARQEGYFSSGGPVPSPAGAIRILLSGPIPYPNFLGISLFLFLWLSGLILAFIFLGWLLVPLATQFLCDEGRTPWSILLALLLLLFVFFLPSLLVRALFVAAAMHCFLLIT